MACLSFVIPCYCSELTIEHVISEIHCKMAERKDYTYEIIAVNDSSPDNVLDVLKRIVREDKYIRIIDLAKNSGKHAAMMAGFHYVSGDIIVNLDDDGQCPMDRLWDLLQPLEEGFDISIARYSKKRQSAFKRFGSKVNSIMSEYLVGKPKSIEVTNFNAVKRYVIDEMCRYSNPYPYIEGLFFRTTTKIKNVDMEERVRAAGEGHFTFRKSLALFLNGFTAFSVKPLRIATVMGFVCAAVGIFLGVVVIIRKFLTPDVLMGYSSIMAVLLFIGGLLMVMLGLIGEYIGRIYISINNSPQYVVREKINCGEELREDKSVK